MFQPNGAFRVVSVPRMSNICQECGCRCNCCINNDSLDLHHEIEVLRSKLKKSESHVTSMEREFVESKEYADNEISKLQDELAKLRDRYDRLYESHKKMQKVNHNLEDKLLKIVNKFDVEKTALQKDVSSLTSKLVDAKVTICDLEEENERFRSDCNIAVQMLQCRPSNYLAHKLNTLPLDLQERVKSHMTREQIINMEDAENDPTPTKMIRVPMPTFPPTAMVYSVNKVPPTNAQNNDSDAQTGNKPDSVPTSLIAKVLTQGESARKPRRVYICSKCAKDCAIEHRSTQTSLPYTDANGYQGVSPPRGAWPLHGYHGHVLPPGVHVHRPRNNSTETEI